MKEAFLHYVWSHKLFDLTDLCTTEGDRVSIENTGSYNLSSGPDFAEARVKINQTLWAGSIEIHIRSSDWYQHGHQSDEAYDNVILHVVYEHDKEVLIHEKPIPTLELKERIASSLISNYDHLRLNANKIPCVEALPNVPAIKVNFWLDRMLTERLEEKCADIELIYRTSEESWMETFYVLLFGAFGQKYNKQPLQELARKVPFQLSSRYRDKSSALQAFLLGVSGFLDHQDLHPDLHVHRTEFEFLRRKHRLNYCSQQWKTGRVRPDNSPSRRVAQLAFLIPHLEHIYREIMAGMRVSWYKIPLEESGFWNSHYHISDRVERSLSFGISPAFSELLNINVVAPFQFFYGQKTGDAVLKKHAVITLEKSGAEENTIIRNWSKAGVKCHSAAQSQALLQLQKNYCNHKKCVLCNIGKTIIAGL